MKRNTLGFTIVEIMVIVAIIGILTAIGFVSFGSIQSSTRDYERSSKAKIISEALEKYYDNNGEYPGCAAMAEASSTVVNSTLAGLDPNTLSTPSTTDGENSILPSCGDLNAGDDSFAYVGNTDSSCLTGGSCAFFSLKYYSEESNSIKEITSRRSAPLPPITLAESDPDNWIAVGTQIWAKHNLNVGTRINGSTEQTNNSTVEKYCYNNTDSNCTTYGGLYQWDEAMQYITAEGAQGICPSGSHIPTDNEWKTLEMQLGMTQAQADIDTDWRGTDQSIRLRSGGDSGLNILFTGIRNYDGSFMLSPQITELWSSSAISPGVAESRLLHSGYTTIYREPSGGIYGFSVRCVGN